MRDSLEWRSAAGEALARGGASVATVVDVVGSAFRHEGARLFIRSGDSWEGNISGGCLEPDVAARAQDLAEAGRGETRRYDLAEEDMWGLGLGCGGQVEVLVEPLPGALYRTMLSAPRGGVAVRPLPLEAGPLPGPGEVGPVWWWEAPDGPLRIVDTNAPGDAAEVRVRGSAAGPAPPELARRAAARYASGESGSEVVRVEGGERRYFFDVVRPPRRLVVCGAGHDSAPLVDLAATAGFTVTVIDPRHGYLTSDRFPRAARRILAEPAEGLRRLDLAPEDAIIVKNHHKARDRAALAAALATPAGYVGQLGPRGRTLKMLEEAGIAFGEVQGRLHAPVGLDIGGESPEQIAVSAVAELLAWANGRAGGPLRAAEGPIHGSRPSGAGRGSGSPS